MVPMLSRIVIVALLALAGCYSKVCLPSDPTCWSCANPGNKNPTCPNFPTDAKQKKAAGATPPQPVAPNPGR